MAAAPSAPQNPAVTAASMGDFTVEWEAPVSDGGQAIQSYEVTASSTEPTAATGTCSTTAPDTSCVVEDLDNGIPYTFAVTATNVDGTSASASSASATAVGYPMAPRALDTTPGDAVGNVTWTAPVSNGGAAILGYQVSTVPSSAGCTTTGALGCTIPGLTNGTTYTVSVIATNQYGSSNPADPTADVTPRTVPDAPTDVTALHLDGGATVAWTPPVDDGGSAITGYVVTTSPTSAGCTTDSVTTTCDISGLANGASYTVYVQAQNVAGLSTTSAAVTVIPSGIPGAPLNVAAEPGNTVADISWSPPASDGGDEITDYTVTTEPASSGCVVSTTSCQLTGLANGTTYTVSVTATNINGTSGPSDTVDVTPFTVPDAPTLTTATPGNQTATIAWTAPADSGGSAIVSYTVSTSPASDGCTVASPAVTCNLAGLTNGTEYTVSVVATNAGGNSVSSNTLAVTPRTVPTPPIAVAATPGNTEAVVTWSAPTNNGGNAIASYTATASPGAATCTIAAPATTCTITGLTNGTAYTVSVVATNAAGNSAASATAAVTPRTVPGAPQNVVATAGNSAVQIAWDAPASNGGSVITGYTVTGSPAGSCTTNGSTSCVITGLTNGTEYTFTVTATNAAGTGIASDGETATPVTVPTQPVSVTATGGANSVLVTWQAPADSGGSPVTSYTVNGAPSGSCVTASTECLITGLTNGELYNFTVFATSDVGDGLPSAAAAARTWAVPSVPQNLTLKRPSQNAAKNGLGQIRASWLPPVSNGGSTITQYVVTGGGATCTTTGTSCVLRGLTSAKTSVSVVAVNGMGASNPVRETLRARTLTIKRKYVGPNRVKFYGKGLYAGQSIELVRDRNRKLTVVKTKKVNSSGKWKATITVPWSSADWKARSLGYKSEVKRTG